MQSSSANQNPTTALIERISLVFDFTGTMSPSRNNEGADLHGTSFSYNICELVLVQPEFGRQTQHLLTTAESNTKTFEEFYRQSLPNTMISGQIVYHFGTQRDSVLGTNTFPDCRRTHHLILLITSIGDTLKSRFCSRSWWNRPRGFKRHLLGLIISRRKRGRFFVARGKSCFFQVGWFER